MASFFAKHRSRFFLPNSFNPEPAATADLWRSIISLILRSPSPFDPSRCLPAVAVGSGLNELTAVSEVVFEIAQLQKAPAKPIWRSLQLVHL